MIKRPLINVISSTILLVMLPMFFGIFIFNSFGGELGLDWVAERWNPQQYYFGYKSLYMMLDELGFTFKASANFIKNVIQTYASWSLDGINEFTQYIDNIFQSIKDFDFNAYFNNPDNTLLGILEVILQFFECLFMYFVAIPSMYIWVAVSIFELTMISPTLYLISEFYFIFVNLVLLITGGFNLPVHNPNNYVIPDWREVWNFTFN